MLRETVQTLHPRNHGNLREPVHQCLAHSHKKELAETDMQKKISFRQQSRNTTSAAEPNGISYYMQASRTALPKTRGVAVAAKHLAEHEVELADPEHIRTQTH